MREATKAELMVALDFSDQDRVERLVRDLDGLPIVYKIGSELFCHLGPDFVKRLTGAGHRVFLDLKFYDIPNTVAKSVRQVLSMEVEFFTFHLSGGAEMMKAALAEVQESSRSARALGVTVLTSFSEAGWARVSEDLSNRENGEGRSIGTAVQNLVKTASVAGLKGIVCSAHELEMLRLEYPHLYMVVPGIRLEGEQAHDQNRVMTPQRAVAAGADALVVGRSITLAGQPRQVAETILGEIR